VTELGATSDAFNLLYGCSCFLYALHYSVRYFMLTKWTEGFAQRIKI